MLAVRLYVKNADVLLIIEQRPGLAEGRLKSVYDATCTDTCSPAPRMKCSRSLLFAFFSSAFHSFCILTMKTVAHLPDPSDHKKSVLCSDGFLNITGKLTA
jgi:hypothetical protein